MHRILAIVFLALAATSAQAQARIVKIEEIDSLANEKEITLRVEVASDIDFFPYPVVMALAGKDTIANKSGDLTVYGVTKTSTQVLTLRTPRLPKGTQEYTIALTTAESSMTFSTTAPYRPKPYKAPKVKKEKKPKETPPKAVKASKEDTKLRKSEVRSTPPAPPKVD